MVKIKGFTAYIYMIVSNINIHVYNRHPKSSSSIYAYNRFVYGRNIDKFFLYLITLTFLQEKVFANHEICCSSL
jgi:hypothetical protein